MLDKSIAILYNNKCNQSMKEVINYGTYQFYDKTFLLALGCVFLNDWLGHLFWLIKKIKKISKKVLTNRQSYGIIKIQ